MKSFLSVVLVEPSSQVCSGYQNSVSILSPFEPWVSLGEAKAGLRQFFVNLILVWNHSVEVIGIQYIRHACALHLVEKLFAK